MKNTNRSIFFILFTILTFSQSSFAITSTLNQPINPIPPNSATLNWEIASNLPPGAHIAYLVGDPTKKEFYVALLKLPANYFVPIHSHLNTEYNTVLSGTYYLGKGNKVNPKETIALPTGTFIAFPAGFMHYGFTKSETILEISGIGEWGTFPNKL